MHHTRARDRTWPAAKPTASLAFALVALTAGASSTQEGAALGRQSPRADTGRVAVAAPVTAAALVAETVRFTNGSVTLAGTLVRPATGPAAAAVVLVHGSGPDEGNAYRVYATRFAEAGIATLVYDKRGYGASTGDWRYRTLDDLSDDALAAVRYLERRPDLGTPPVGLWGISQGSWIVALAASRAPDVAFIVTVAGDGVSPTQQEMYHKDQIFRQLGYSSHARDLALRFWRMTFDWLVRVADGRFPLPRGVMEAELSGAYFGLDHDPIPDWERVRQPALLLYGERDLLTPVGESIARICRALTRSGHRDHTFVVFPGAVHNITLGTNGLAFPWDTGFAPGYFETTTGWMLARTRGPAAVAAPPRECPYGPSEDFASQGRYGVLPWYGRLVPQSVALLLAVLVFASGVVAWMIGGIVRGVGRRGGATGGGPDPGGRARHVAGFVSLVDLLLIAGFVLLLADAVFPHGMGNRAGTIPTALRLLPLLGLVSVAATAVLLALVTRSSATPRRRELAHHRVIAACATLFLAWLAYWNLVGAPL